MPSGLVPLTSDSLTEALSEALYISIDMRLRANGLFGSDIGFEVESAAATFILACSSFIVNFRSPPSSSSAGCYGFGGVGAGGFVIGTVSLIFSDALSSTGARGLTFGGLLNYG